MNGRLEGRIALVTGGMRGIGRGIVQCLAADGATVYATDLDAVDSDAVAELLRTIPGVRYTRLDASSEQQWIAARDRVEQETGRLDILANNVGTEISGKVQNTDLAAWQKLMSVNVDSCFLGVKTFQPLLAKGGAATPYGSSIINTSSIMGLVGISDSSAYVASKGAVRLFTKAIAIEFAEAGVPIRANSVHPGFVETGQLMAGFRKMAAKLGNVSPDQLLESAVQSTPLKRMAQPTEIGKVVAFLASDDSSYMTGSEVVVDGGWTAR